MEIKDRVEALEGEFKLIKGELKETLASVRDYLTDLKLPPADDPALMAGIIEEESPVTRSEVVLTSSGSPQQAQMQQPQMQPQAQQPQMQPQAQQPQMQPQAQQAQMQPQAQQAQMQPQAQPPPWMQQLAAEELAELPELEMDELEMAGLDTLEPPQEQDGLRENVSREAARQEANLFTPQVNLLSNLIRWVSNAKKDIGSEQLPIFLEVYGISGHLAPELKETILHLAEISEPPAMDENAADVWSQLILELHGILTGGDAPLHPIKPFWGEEAAETAPVDPEAAGLAAEQPAEDPPFKLKLVLPGGDGKGKEYSISLNPEMDIESTARCQPPKRKPRNER